MLPSRHSANKNLPVYLLMTIIGHMALLIYFLVKRTGHVTEIPNRIIAPASEIDAIKTAAPIVATIPPTRSWTNRITSLFRVVVSSVVIFILINLVLPQAASWVELLFPFSQPESQSSLSSSAVELGGVNLLEYCLSKYGGIPYTRKFKPNAYAWRCQLVEVGLVPTVVFYHISINEACQAQYGDGAFAHSLDEYSAYQWRCYTDQK